MRTRCWKLVDTTIECTDFFLRLRRAWLQPRILPDPDSFVGHRRQSPHSRWRFVVRPLGRLRFRPLGDRSAEGTMALTMALMGAGYRADGRLPTAHRSGCWRRCCFCDCASRKFFAAEAMRRRGAVGVEHSPRHRSRLFGSVPHNRSRARPTRSWAQGGFRALQEMLSRGHRHLGWRVAFLIEGVVGCGYRGRLKASETPAFERCPRSGEGSARTIRRVFSSRRHERDRAGLVARWGEVQH